MADLDSLSAPPLGGATLGDTAVDSADLAGAGGPFLPLYEVDGCYVNLGPWLHASEPERGQLLDALCGMPETTTSAGEVHTVERRAAIPEVARASRVTRSIQDKTGSDGPRGEPEPTMTEAAMGMLEFCP